MSLEIYRKVPVQTSFLFGRGLCIYLNLANLLNLNPRGVGRKEKQCCKYFQNATCIINLTTSTSNKIHLQKPLCHILSNKISKSSLRIVSSFPAPYLNIRHVTKGLGHCANSQPWLSGSFVNHCLEFRTHHPSETRLGPSSTGECQFIPKYREFVTRFWR